MAPTDNKRRPVLGVSTKMYFSVARTRDYVNHLVESFAKDEATKAEKKNGKSILDDIDALVVPDFITLPSVVEQLKGTRILPAAQDCAWEDYGAFTGFVSPAVLADVGVKVVVVGHAERRRLLGETDDTVAAKASAVVRHGMIPLVCIGEVQAPADDAHTATSVSFIVSQIEPVLTAVPDDAEVLLAYEPVWAIGAAHPASAAYVREVVAGIRACASIQKRGASRTRILYGGSAGPGLFTQLAGVVDGLFLGRFGHDPAVFMQTAQELAHHA